MHETLKELTAELAVLHESLERAEVIERQLPAYLREIEAERDEAIAERDRLRSEVERLRGYNESLLKERDGHIHAAAGLRRALEEAPDYIDNPMTGDAASVLRRYVNTALAASPDDHARRLKSEALREFAKSRDIEVVGNGDWYAGIAAERTATVDDLRETADRLEAANGR
jgi:chromosome segregation ATPase